MLAYDFGRESRKKGCGEECASKGVPCKKLIVVVIESLVSNYLSRSVRDWNQHAGLDKSQTRIIHSVQCNDNMDFRIYLIIGIGIQT